MHRMGANLLIIIDSGFETCFAFTPHRKVLGADQFQITVVGTF